MALLNANKLILKRAVRIERRVGSLETWLAMAAIARTVSARDPLELRAMWRRNGRPLERRATVVGGKLERHLVP